MNTRGALAVLSATRLTARRAAELAHAQTEQVVAFDRSYESGAVSRNLLTAVSRDSLARFLLDCVDSHDFPRQAPGGRQVGDSAAGQENTERPTDVT